MAWWCVGRPRCGRAEGVGQWIMSHFAMCRPTQRFTSSRPMSHTASSGRLRNRPLWQVWEGVEKKVCIASGWNSPQSQCGKKVEVEEVVETKPEIKFYHFPSLKFKWHYMKESLFAVVNSSSFPTVWLKTITIRYSFIKLFFLHRIKYLKLQPNTTRGHKRTNHI